MNKLITTAVICALATGCTTAAQHQQAVNSYDEEQLTVAAVQRTIREGMSGAEVLAALGSPNIISTDADRNEVWVWDKVSREVSYSRSSGVVAGLVVGSSGGGVGGGSKNAGAASSSQRTLTVIVKFDDAGLVSDFSYRTSSF